MKAAYVARAACLGLGLLVAGTPGGASRISGAEPGDKTLSPYFFIPGGHEGVDLLPLKSTRADVRIAGVIADVTVTQEYRNEGKKTLEAVYVFPGSTRAAVHAMKMTIGERVVKADIRKREEARAEYENALKSGQTASLLEQQRPNVFQMNVGNIQPGDRILVEMEYTELLVPEKGVYEFMYPTVVGPRYSNRSADGAPEKDKWSQNPYLHQGEDPPTTFGLSADLSAGMPIQDVLCTSHQVDVTFKGKTRAHVELAASDKNRGNKDFILQYRLQGEGVQTGLLLFRGEKENFFLLMAQPPKRLTAMKMPPRDYVFIVDVSGSMSGFPLEVSKTLLKDLINGLKPTDTFNVLLFAGGSSVLSDKPLSATAANLKKAVEMIDAQSGGGGTELLPALRKALSLPRGENVSRSVVIATDGYVTVEEEAFDLIRNSLGEANLFAFGIGSSVNRFLIEGMARAGMGEPFVVTKPDEASDQAAEFRRMIGSPALTRLEVDWGGLKPYDVEPPSLPDVMAERPVIVFGKWRGTPGKVTVRGRQGEGRYEQTVSAVPSAGKGLEALRYLWARHRIATLGDTNALKADDKRVKEITDLGLAYHLLTAYTSFVAVDQVKRGDGTYQTVKQPLPLPEGVSDLAVGGIQPSGALASNCAKAAAPMMMAAEVSADSSVAGLSRNKQAARETKDKGAGAVSLSLDRVSVSGSLTGAAVRGWFEQNRTTLESCLSGWNPSASKFECVLKVSIGGDGTVTGVTIGKTGTISRSIAECLKKLLAGMGAPAPSDGKPAVVTMTLTSR